VLKIEQLMKTWFSGGGGGDGVGGSSGDFISLMPDDG
jgi:hypothetical protein